MCVSIYAALIALFFYYSDFIISAFVLAVPTDGNSIMAIAVGWEMVSQLWPLVVLAMVVSSALTLYITFKIQGRNKTCCAGDDHV
jgi:membrane protein implicated in regulation of membrane protease activity